MFGPGIEHSISLLLTVGLRASWNLLFKFELLPLFVKQLVLLFVLSQLLPGPVFAQHCSLPTPRTLSFLMLQFVPFFSISIPIVLQFIFEMFNNSMSGMPNNASPFPGTTKKMHFLCLSLFSVSTLHVPNCVTVVQLYVLSLGGIIL